MAAGRVDSPRAEFERFKAAQRSARKKTSELLGEARFGGSKRALLQRQRAARKAIAEALGKTYGGRASREIAFQLSEWFEEAAFLAALQLDPKRFFEGGGRGRGLRRAGECARCHMGGRAGGRRPPSLS